VLAIARRLERGGPDEPVARALSALWRHTLGRSVVRRLAWPGHVRVVAVGGATLGGSGKTPVAVACAAELAAAGARVALVGHAYRASPGRARFVSSWDPVRVVGDEALVAARALAACGARVVVAPSRAAAIALAARDADVLVLDGVAQTAPARASLALLAVDAREPWGRAAALPPRGDLRAPCGVLLGACDAVVSLRDEADAGAGDKADDAADDAAGDAADEEVIAHAVAKADADRVGVYRARAASRGAWSDAGDLLTWDALRAARVGLLLALARPERVLRGLARRGVRPTAVVRAGDHGPFSRGHGGSIRAARQVDLWLATPKCAAHALPVCRSLRAPLATLDHSVSLDAALRARLRTLSPP